MCGSHHIRTNLTQIYAVRTKKPRSLRGFGFIRQRGLVVIANQNFSNLYGVCRCTFAYVISNYP